MPVPHTEVRDSLYHARQTSSLPHTLKGYVLDYCRVRGVPFSEALRTLSDAAGIQPDTVREIIRGRIKSPPDERLEGFAQVLSSVIDPGEVGNTRGTEAGARTESEDHPRAIEFETAWTDLQEIVGDGIQLLTLARQKPNTFHFVDGELTVTTTRGRETLPREWLESAWSQLKVGPLTEERLSGTERYRSTAILTSMSVLPYVEYSTHPRTALFLTSHVFRNAELSSTFGVGPQRGIRYTGKAQEPKHIIFITDRPKGGNQGHPYRDRWEDECFHYTGEGLTGDQSMTRGNLALKVSSERRAPVYGFEKKAPDQYAYMGRFEVIDADQEEQQDTAGNRRKVFVFKMKPQLHRQLPIPSSPQAASNAWIFQANPNTFDLSGALCELDEMTFLVLQHKDRIQLGDRVYLWESQGGRRSEAGIVAVATVIEAPKEAPFEPAEVRFVRDEGNLGGTQWRVKLDIERVLTEPLPRSVLREHEILKDLTVIRAPQGTNFSVTPEQAQAMKELLSQEGVTISPETSRTTGAPERVTFRVEALPADWNWQEQMKRLIDRVHATGFVFDPWQIAAYVTALRTKPFVILAGISGTGKSQLPQLVADACGYSCELVPVRPDWTDSSDLLGYTDLEGRFRPGRLLEVAAQAGDNVHQGYTVVLDEMNLARVEHYFAEMLSRIEDRSLEGAEWFCKPLLSTPFERPADAEQLDYSRVSLPPNLAVVGTVNMDESTHGFSRKVLDRAFTLELSDVDLNVWGSRAASQSPASLGWPSSAMIPRTTRLASVTGFSESDTEIIDRVIEVLNRLNDQLRVAQLQVGYRVRDEVALFVLNAEEVTESFVTRVEERVDPLDLAISMKVLPRIIGGSGAIRRVLKGLLAWAIAREHLSDADADQLVEAWQDAGRPQRLSDEMFPLSAARLCLMWERLADDGFTSYWL